MDLIAAFTLGLIGSLHCLGMCGPIAVALPFSGMNWLHKVTGAILYNAGRIITYGIMGAAFGLLGRGIKLAGLQQWASILLGGVMIISVLFPFIFREKIRPGQLFSGYANLLIDIFRRYFNKESLTSLLVIGLLNGLLPCGLVYLAIAGAINTNDVTMGVVFMVAFGIGTTPALIILSLAGNVVGAGLRKKAGKIVPAFIIILGILFILRGMSLGIPYISPKSHKLEIRKEMPLQEPCCR
jgi:uncharacterized protein